MNLSFSLLAIGFVGNLLFLFSAQAQQPPPLNPPPLAQPVSVSVYSGRSVEIPLQASGRTPSQVRFIIRTKPRYGTLGEIRLTGRASAVVTYTRSDKDSLQPDSFRYAVQTVDSPVSAAADVLISVTEEAPRLEAPEAVDFGSVFVGETVSRTVSLANTGGGRLLGRLQSDDAFSLEGADSIILNRQGQKKITILFRPEREGGFSGFLFFDTNPRTGVQMTGQALTPLSVAPSTSLVVSRDAPTPVSIENVSSTTRTVVFSSPQGIKPLPSVELSPGASTSLEIEIAPEHLAAIEGMLVIKSEGFKKTIPLSAFAAPPHLKAFPSGGLDFGSMALGDRRSLPLRLVNIGGADARLQASLPAGVEVDPLMSATILSPGDERSFVVSFEASKSGSFEKEILIEVQGAPGLRIPLRGTTSQAASIVAMAASTPAPAPTPVAASSAPLLQLAPPPELSDLPPINAFSLRKGSPNSLELAWPKPSGDVSRYVVEKRRIEIDGDNPPRVIWEKWTEVAITDQGKEIVASFTGLPANAAWYIRVFAIDPQGRSSPPSPSLRIGTPPMPRSFGIYWICGFLLLGLGFFVWKKIAAAREATAREDAERISRL